MPVLYENLIGFGQKIARKHRGFDLFTPENNQMNILGIIQTKTSHNELS